MNSKTSTSEVEQLALSSHRQAPVGNNCADQTRPADFKKAVDSKRACVKRSGFGSLSKCEKIAGHCLFLLLWICAGASAAEPLAHWAFQPVTHVDLPRVRNQAWVRNPIDRFILAAQEARGLVPAAPATREQLIRRVALGLVGLPPTPAEIDAFVHDPSEQANERLVERLLASPHYGVRWARHWLDLARYAESDGFEHDALRPNSWRYRDYVIRVFNQDKPYDRFIREQIAGDEFWPEDPEALTATAFNLLGPDMVDSADQVQRRLNTLNDATDTAVSVFLAQTIGCARCHNHKFEPFQQRDYFGLQAFFASADFVRDLPVPSPSDRRAFDDGMARYREAAESTQKELDLLEGPYREKLRAEKMSRLSEDAQLAHRTPKQQRTVEQEGTVAETAPALNFTDAELNEKMTASDREQRVRHLTALKRIPKPPPLPTTLALRNKPGSSPKTFVLQRGDYNQPGEEVQSGIPVVLRGENSSTQKSDLAANRRVANESTCPRSRLANWIADPANPLTARVMVNRIWQHHFARGLVATPSDFGTRGAVPTHPQLLDWLAAEFMASGWSVKAMQRLILSSATYQQSSLGSPESLARDPDNLFLSRQNRVRLEGEAVRDSLLFISGRLNTRLGGPGVSPPISPEITKTSKNWATSSDPADHTLRSIYILARRNLRFPFLEAFDAPDSNLSCPIRGHSTTAPQTLTLLNSDEVMAAAVGTANHLQETIGSDEARIREAFRWILGRAPTAKEQTLASDFLLSCQSRSKDAPSSASWVELCRSLYNLNAFIYVD